MVVEVMSQGKCKTEAAHRLGISRSTFYKWIEKYPSFAEAVEEGQAALEAWSHKHYRGMMLENNPQLWNMWMKNVCGWRDKVEHAGDDEKPLVINLVSRKGGKSPE